MGRSSSFFENNSEWHVCFFRKQKFFHFFLSVYFEPFYCNKYKPQWNEVTLLFLKRRTVVCTKGNTLRQDSRNPLHNELNWTRIILGFTWCSFERSTWFFATIFRPLYDFLWFWVKGKYLTFYLSDQKNTVPQLKF